MRTCITAVLIVGFSLILSCSSSKKIKTASASYPREYNGKANELFSDNDFEEGKNLIALNDCFTCHRFAEGSIGPSFQAIATKYENITTPIFFKLSEKIRIGGGGNWGEVPMVPHSSLVADQSDLILKYILLTKYKTP